MCGVLSVFREKDFQSWLSYVAKVNWIGARWLLQQGYASTLVPLRQVVVYVLAYFGVHRAYDWYEPVSLSEEMTQVSRVFLFGEKEEELQKQKIC